MVNVTIYTIHGSYGIYPSGKHTKNYGKSPFLMGKSTISMAISNSFLYVYQRVYIKNLKSPQPPIHGIIELGDFAAQYGTEYQRQSHFLAVCNLVGCFKHFVFSTINKGESFPLTFIFFKMVKTTNQIMNMYVYIYIYIYIYVYYVVLTFYLTFFLACVRVRAQIWSSGSPFFGRYNMVAPPLRWVIPSSTTYTSILPQQLHNWIHPSSSSRAGLVSISHRPA